MKNFIQQLQLTRDQLLSRARKVSAYFTDGGGANADEPSEPRERAWTSEDQKQRAKDFHELATKLAEENRAA